MKKNFEHTEFGEGIDRMRKGRCMKIGAKTLRNNFRMKATADEFDVIDCSQSPIFPCDRRCRCGSLMRAKLKTVQNVRG